MRRSQILVLLAAVAASGCLSSSHEIPREELFALTELPPEERGEEVRVVQNLGHQDEPPGAPRVQVGAAVVVDGPVWVAGTPRSRNRSRITSVDDTRRAPSGKRRGNLAEAKKESAKVWIAVAAIAAGALAFTEGARYDGWVRLHPMHPVHLVGPGGQYTWIPLAQLTPEAVDWSERAYVRDVEGPWQPLGRAPLDRRGFTYSLFLGGGEIALVGADPEPGFMSHIDLGFYPAHAIGLQLDIGFGWADDELGDTVFDARYALELDVLPLEAGILHGGVFGQIGVASRSDDGLRLDDSSSLMAGGALLQLELTTRLALGLRAGLTRAHGETMSELGIGVSIY